MSQHLITNVKNVGVASVTSNSNVVTPGKQATAMVLKLCQTIKSGKDQELVSKSLQFFASPELMPDVIGDSLDTILKTLCQPNDGKDGWSSVECTSMAAIGNLQNLMPEKMISQLKLWWRFMANAVVDSSPAVRAEAMAVLTRVKDPLAQNRDVFPRFASYVKLTMFPKMVSLFNNREEVYILQLWKLLLTILGKTLHTGSAFINVLLGIPELAFKHKSENVKLASYSCWLVFIDNFASNPEVINQVPRLKLLLHPFKFFNYSTKPLIETQLLAWWHVAVALGCRLQNHLEMVIEPLLEVCFGLETQDSSRTTPNRLSGRLNVVTGRQSMGAEVSQGFKFHEKFFMNFGIQVLWRLLEEPDSTCKLEGPTIVEPLTSSLLSKKFLLFKHHSILFKSLEVASTNVQGAPHCSIIAQIWTNMLSVVRKCAKLENKMDGMDFVTSFFLAVKSIVGREHPDAHLLRLSRDLLTLTITTCPTVTLMSSAFVLRERGSLHDTPSLLLLELLLSKHMVAQFAAEEELASLVTVLVGADRANAEQVPTLEFFQMVTGLCDRAHFAHFQMKCDVWKVLAQSLSLAVDTTHEVNQGDASEHDYGCLYDMLLFPIKHRLYSSECGTSRQPIRRTWGKLFEQMLEHAGSQDTSVATRNDCCYRFLVKLLPVAAAHVTDVEELYWVVKLLATVLTEVRWPIYSSQAAVPGDSTSLIDLLILALDKSMVKVKESTPKDDDRKMIIKIVVKLLDVCELLFKGLSEANFMRVLLRMVAGLSQMIKFSGVVGNCFWEPSQFAVVTRLWSQVATALPLHFRGSHRYKTKLLTSLSPLFEATLVHPRDCISQTGRILWNTTFATSYDKLAVPATLAEVIKNANPVMFNGQLRLDSNVGSLSASGEESSASLSTVWQELTAKSELRLLSSPVIPAPPTPKAVPSFSGTTFSSPILTSKTGSSFSSPATPKSGGKPQVADLLDIDSQDFVVISSQPAKRNRALTEHQKEVRLTKKTSIPALYSDLSQDSVSQTFKESDSDTCQSTFCEEESVRDRPAFFKQPEPPVTKCSQINVVPESMEVSISSSDSEIVVDRVPHVAEELTSVQIASQTSKDINLVVANGGSIIAVDDHSEVCQEPVPQVLLPTIDAEPNVSVTIDTRLSSGLALDPEDIANEPFNAPPVADIVEEISSDQPVGGSPKNANQMSLKKQRLGRLPRVVSTNGVVAEVRRLPLAAVKVKADTPAKRRSKRISEEEVLTKIRSRRRGVDSPLPKIAAHSAIVPQPRRISMNKHRDRLRLLFKLGPDQEKIQDDCEPQIVAFTRDCCVPVDDLTKICQRKTVSEDVIVAASNSECADSLDASIIDMINDKNSNDVTAAIDMPINLPNDKHNLKEDASPPAAAVNFDVWSAKSADKDLPLAVKSATPGSSELIREMGNASPASVLAEPLPDAANLSRQEDVSQEISPIAASNMKRAMRKRKSSPVHKTPSGMPKKRLADARSMMVGKRRSLVKRPSEEEVVDMARARRMSLKETLTSEKNKPFHTKILVPRSSSPISEKVDTVSLDDSTSTVEMELTSQIEDCPLGPSVIVTNLIASAPIKNGPTEIVIESGPTEVVVIESSPIEIDPAEAAEIECDPIRRAPIESAQSVVVSDNFNALANSSDTKTSLERVWSMNGCISITYSSDVVPQTAATVPDEITLEPISVEIAASESYVIPETVEPAIEEIVQQELVESDAPSSPLPLNTEWNAAVEAGDESMSPVRNSCQLIVREDPFAGSVASPLPPPSIDAADYEDQTDVPMTCPDVDCLDSDPKPSASSVSDSVRVVDSVTFSPQRSAKEADADAATSASIAVVLSRLESPCGVLKKQRIREVGGICSPSPLKKRKVVSFADPPAYDQHNVPYLSKSKNRIERGGRFNRRLQLNGSPRRTYASRRVAQLAEQETKSQDSEQSAATSDDATQGSYESPSITEMNSTDPIYPSLLNCTDSISNILPRLTSTLWTRGLNNMLQSRNIKTIGDLSALTEADISNLPIRSPKIKVFRQSMDQYQSKTTKAPTPEVATSSGVGFTFRDKPVVDDADVAELPSLEDAMDTWLPEKGPSADVATEPQSSKERIESLTLEMVRKATSVFADLEPEDFKNMPCELFTRVQEGFNSSVTLAMQTWLKANCNK